MTVILADRRAGLLQLGQQFHSGDSVRDLAVPVDDALHFKDGAPELSRHRLRVSPRDVADPVAINKYCNSIGI